MSVETLRDAQASGRADFGEIDEGTRTIGEEVRRLKRISWTSSAGSPGSPRRSGRRSRPRT